MALSYHLSRKVYSASTNVLYLHPPLAAGLTAQGGDLCLGQAGQLGDGRVIQEGLDSGLLVVFGLLLQPDARQHLLVGADFL